MTNKSIDDRNNDMILTLASSLLIAALTIVASVAGLMSPSALYPSDALRQFALANDVTNLLIGVPILVVSVWLDRRGKHIGRLLWPGALMYALYNYLAYVVALPVSWFYIAYLLIVTLCVYTLMTAFMYIDAERARRRLAGKVPERFSAVVLILLGGFVFMRVFGVIASAQLAAGEVAITERSLLLVDVLLAPAWIIGGIMLWKKQAFGYAAGLALLFQGSMLFLGLIIVLALQPILNDLPLPLIDIIVVTAMGLICFIPLSKFLRAAASAD